MSEDDAAVKTPKDALVKRAEMNIVGYSYVQERSFDTLEGAATNPGSAQAVLMGAGIGLGIGVGIGGGMGQQMGGIMQYVNTTETKQCPACNATIDTNNRFCTACGHNTKLKKCSNHGITIERTPKFCPKCGNKL